MRQISLFYLVGCTAITLLIPNSLQARTVDYGTPRKPRVCPSRVEPKTGPINVNQAKMYFTCGSESESLGNIRQAQLVLIDDLTIEVAPRGRKFLKTDLNYIKEGGKYIAIDTERPVYDIRGSFLLYSCRPIATTRPAGRNCFGYRYPASQGICFQSTFGEWHCTMRGNREKIADPGPPPRI